jgi:hypothetical protein
LRQLSEKHHWSGRTSNVFRGFDIMRLCHQLYRFCSFPPRQHWRKAGPPANSIIAGHFIPRTLDCCLWSIKVMGIPLHGMVALHVLVVSLSKPDWRHCDVQ